MAVVCGVFGRWVVWFNDPVGLWLIMGVFRSIRIRHAGSPPQSTTSQPPSLSASSPPAVTTETTSRAVDKPSTQSKNAAGKEGKKFVFDREWLEKDLGKYPGEL